MLSLGARFKPGPLSRHGYELALGQASELLSSRLSRTLEWPALVQRPLALRVAASAAQRIRAAAARRADQWVPVLSHGEIAAVRTLSRLRSVVMRSADKGLGTTVMGADWYDSEMARLLAKASEYVLVDDAGACARAARAAIGGQSFTAEGPLPYCYLVPKLHKVPPKGRLIVSAAGSLYAKCTVWLADRLQEQLVALQTCFMPATVLDGTLSAVKRIRRFAAVRAAELCLVTYDFSTLYTSLPHWMVLESWTRNWQLLYGLNVAVWPRDVRRARDLLSCLLRHTYMQEPRSGRTYRQVHGIPMGFSACVAIANGVLWDSEHRSWARDDLVKPLLVLRLLDDLLLVGCEQDVHRWVRETYHSSLERDVQQVGDRVHYLDLWVTLQHSALPNGQRAYTLALGFYEKPGAAHEYTHWRAAVPMSAKTAMVHGVVMRRAWLAGSYAAFVQLRTRLLRQLVGRGYPMGWLRQVSDGVSYVHALQIRDTIISGGERDARHPAEEAAVRKFAHLLYIPGLVEGREVRRAVLEALRSYGADSSSDTMSAWMVSWHHSAMLQVFVGNPRRRDTVWHAGGTVGHA